MDGPGKEVVSINANLSGPAHVPKTTGEQLSNTFMCDVLRGNGNEEYSLNNKCKAYTDMNIDSKTEIITDITCKFNGKLVAIGVKVDPGFETNYITLSHFRHLFLNQPWHNLRHMMVKHHKPTDGSCCQLRTSTCFIL